MSVVKKLVAHLARYGRMTSTGEFAIQIQGVLNLPAAAGVPRRLTAKHFTSKAEHLQLRKSEYGMAAIALALSVLEIQVDLVELTANLSSRFATSSTMPAVQDHQAAHPVEVPAVQ